MVHGKLSIPQKVSSLVKEAGDPSTDPPGEPLPPPAPDTFPYYVSVSTKRRHEELYNGIVDLILKKGIFFNSKAERKKSPFNFKRPEVLQRMTNFRLGREPLVSDGDPKAGVRELLKIMEFVIDYGPHTSHPFMVSKDMAGLDPYGIVADWLATTMSHPVLTYILSPVLNLREYEIQERFWNLIGYKPNDGDGMVTPGQGIGNSHAIQMALQTKFKEEDVKHKGLITKAGKQKITEAKTAGYIPFLIVATAGKDSIG